MIEGKLCGFRKFVLLRFNVLEVLCCCNVLVYSADCSARLEGLDMWGLEFFIICMPLDPKFPPWIVAGTNMTKIWVLFTVRLKWSLFRDLFIFFWVMKDCEYFSNVGHSQFCGMVLIQPEFWYLYGRERLGYFFLLSQHWKIQLWISS